MHNALPPNLAQGIQLVEARRRGEALPYLRFAARTEGLPAEGWLWLAAATDDLEEYRHCVLEALRLDPFHPTAQRMRNDLERQAGWVAYPPPNPYSYAPAAPLPYADEFATRRQETAAHYRPSRLRRAIRILAVALLLGSCLGVIAALIVSGAITNAARDLLAIREAHTLEFTIGEQPGYRFRVEVPETWLPANADSGSWRDARDALIAAFPTPAGQDSVWEQVEVSFSSAVRDPVYGEMLPPVQLVETDSDKLGASGMVAALTLHEIVPFPPPPPGMTVDICSKMRALEAQFSAEGTLNPQPDSEVIETILAARHDRDDCVYAIHRRLTRQPPQNVPFPLAPDRAPDAFREITLAVPVGAERYALWRITLADSAYDDYAYAVERILSTLQYAP
jgi:hypothetical protein